MKTITLAKSTGNGKKSAYYVSTHITGKQSTQNKITKAEAIKICKENGIDFDCKGIESTVYDNNYNIYTFKIK